MNWSYVFFVNSILLGVGLAMDAFSVSLANGLQNPGMKKSKMTGMAGVFAGFQGLMPMIGWICVHTVLRYFEGFEKFVPWIALILLGFIGGKMLVDGIRNQDNEEENLKMGLAALLIQGVATSIDALSVGVTNSEYSWFMALISAIIIAAVTFVICLVGIAIGKRFGTKFSEKATIFGGIILILIGIEIFVKGVF